MLSQLPTKSFTNKLNTSGFSQQKIYKIIILILLLLSWSIITFADYLCPNKDIVVRTTIFNNNKKVGYGYSIILKGTLPCEKNCPSENIEIDTYVFYNKQNKNIIGKGKLQLKSGDLNKFYDKTNKLKEKVLIKCNYKNK